MIKIFVLSKRSLFLLFLVSNTIQADTLALPISVETQIEKKQNKKFSAYDIEQSLNNKGLDKDVASKKVAKLLQKNPQILEICTKLLKHPKLNFSQEDILQTLASYALFEKNIEPNSYDTLVGFAQKIKYQLTKQELQALYELS